MRYEQSQSEASAVTRSVSNSSPLYVFQPFFWISQLLDNCRPTDWVSSMDQCRSTRHVTLCLQWCCLVVRELFVNWKVLLTCSWRFWSI